MKRQDAPVHTVVEGAGCFPVDMMRYDRCTPSRESDSAVILSTFYPGAAARRCRVAVQHTGQLTRGRWESFGWTFKDGETQLPYPPADRGEMGAVNAGEVSEDSARQHLRDAGGKCIS